MKKQLEAFLKLYENKTVLHDGEEYRLKGFVFEKGIIVLYVKGKNGYENKLFLSDCTIL
jgi:hypothetical protein